MKDSRKQAKQLEAMMKAQAEAAAGVELPKFEGAAAAPTQSSVDVEAAGMEMRQRLMRRQGLNQTVYAGAK